jgi:hypothetical protein
MLVSALDFSSEYDTDIIVKDLDTSIKLTLRITDAPAGVYNVYTLSDVSINPSETFTINGKGLVKEFTIKQKENLNVKGYYTFTYTLHHRDVEKIDKKLTIKLLDLNEVIEIEPSSPDYETGEIVFYVRNKENVFLENLSARFSTLLFDIEREFNLKPFEEYKIRVLVDKEILNQTKAGNYIIESFFDTNEGEKKIEGVLYLGEKKSILTEEDKSGLIIRNYIITKTNAGNTLENIQIEVNKNIFSRLFTSFDIEPNLVEREGFSVKYTWIKNRFEPGEVFTLKTRTNYLLPFIIIIVGIIAFFGIKRYAEAKVEITKSVSHVKTKNDEFALKIRLSVKARKNIENATLVDRVPPILKIYNKFGINKPHKIDANNRRIHWNLQNLNAGEERVFSYIVYSKIGVVGKFSLPEAIVVFEKDGKIHEVGSKKVFFMNEQIKK